VGPVEVLQKLAGLRHFLCVFEIGLKVGNDDGFKKGSQFRSALLPRRYSESVHRSSHWEYGCSQVPWWAGRPSTRYQEILMLLAARIVSFFAARKLGFSKDRHLPIPA
jgi:hypothetical protein